GIDRKLERRESFVARPVALARLELHQPFGVELDGIGLVRRWGRDGAGDDAALDQEALGARVDQAGAELRKIKDADDEREQSGDVEEYDAPREAREALGDEELPDAPRRRADRPPGLQR